MSVDARELAGAHMDVALSLLESENRSFADDIMYHIGVPYLSGEYRIDLTGLAYHKSTDEIRSAIGQPPTFRPVRYSKDKYELIRWQDGVRWDEAGYDALSTDSARRLLEKPLIQAVLKMDLDLRSVLTSASDNVTQAVGSGAWSAANSTPTADLLALKQKLKFGADTAVFGTSQIRQLAVHAEFKETISNYSGSGYSDPVAVIAQLSRILEIPTSRIFVDDRKYSADNEYAAVNITDVFDNVVWVGNGRGLVCFHQRPGAATTGEMLDGAGESTFRRYESGDSNAWLKDLAVGRIGQIKRVLGDNNEYLSAGGIITGLT